jgi:hypothetical protein
MTQFCNKLVYMQSVPYFHTWCLPANVQGSETYESLITDTRYNGGSFPVSLQYYKTHNWGINVWTNWGWRFKKLWWVYDFHPLVLRLQALCSLPLVSALHFFHFPLIFTNIQITAQQTLMYRLNWWWCQNCTAGWPTCSSANTQKSKFGVWKQSMGDNI